MNNQSLLKHTPLSLWRMIALVLNYFPGYILIYPRIVREVTLWLDPYARVIPSWLQLLIYSFMIIVSVYLAWPLLKESYESYRKNHVGFLKTCFVLMGVMYIISIFVSLFISFMSNSVTSANQEQVVSTIQLSPYITMFTTLIYAPIVEEILFRGVIYRTIRPNVSAKIAVILSAVSFGFIHIMDSMVNGNLNDTWYLISYALIGYFLCLAYEKTGTIFGSIFLHFINNALAFLLIII